MPTERRSNVLVAPGRDGNWPAPSSSTANGCGARAGGASKHANSCECTCRLLRDGSRGVRRTGSPRTGRHRRDGASTHRRAHDGTDPARSASRPTRRRRTYQRGDRSRAFPQPAHRRVAPRKGVCQAPRQLATSPSTSSGASRAVRRVSEGQYVTVRSLSTRSAAVTATWPGAVRRSRRRGRSRCRRAVGGHCRAAARRTAGSAGSRGEVGLEPGHELAVLGEVATSASFLTPSTAGLLDSCWTVGRGHGFLCRRRPSPPRAAQVRSSRQFPPGAGLALGPAVLDLDLGAGCPTLVLESVFDDELRPGAAPVRSLRGHRRVGAARGLIVLTTRTVPAGGARHPPHLSVGYSRLAGQRSGPHTCRWLLLARAVASTETIGIGQARKARCRALGSRRRGEPIRGA